MRVFVAVLYESPVASLDSAKVEVMYSTGCTLASGETKAPGLTD